MIKFKINKYNMVNHALLLMMFILAGCKAVGPDYVRPETKVRAKWNNELKATDANEINPQALTLWWTTLNDPELSSLIERAVAGNLDLKKASARIREARARRGIANAEMFPTLNVSGSETWTRNSKEALGDRTNKLYSATFDSGWEVDIFGGVRRSIEAATADLQANEENLKDVLVTLAGETALNYVEVRTYQARIAAVNDNIKAQEETYQLTVWRSQAGLSDELAVQQALYNLENSKSQIPTLHTGMEEAMNRVAVLLGEQPGEVHKELEKAKPIPVSSLQVAVGVPAEMLRRRPDIRKAERELAAQTARIGVATAELYPKFSLAGSIGIEGPSFYKFRSNLTSTENWTLNAGPRVSWSIFDAGAIRQNIKVQSALQEQYLITYESTVLAAIEEVENTLVSYADEQSRMENLRKATEAAQTAAELAQQEYEAGLTDFSNVLDAQRSLLSFQDQLAQSKGKATSNLIRLYKALGGGWESLASGKNNSQ